LNGFFVLSAATSVMLWLNCPLHEGTRRLVNAEFLKHFKKGAWLINAARGAICDKDAIAAALESGQLSGYSGKNTHHSFKQGTNMTMEFY
jgi:lactate dehydrogenase-like 2-hydroxyacid dehydrogenase